MEDLALRRLRISKVHHLVHELVDDDKVVADGLLLELLEVLDEDLGQAMQEEDDLGRIGVSAGQGEHCARAVRRARSEEERERERHAR